MQTVIKLIQYCNLKDHIKYYKKSKLIHIIYQITLFF